MSATTPRTHEVGEIPVIDPEPEWLTTLKARMTELQDPDGDNRVPRFAAVKVAFQMLRDAHARIAELEVQGATDRKVGPEETAPQAEPEGLPSLRKMMESELSGKLPAAWVAGVVAAATGVASYHLHHLRAQVAKLERDLGRVTKARDEYAETADQLAYAIGGTEIGEHSSANDPWRNALEIAARRTPAPSPEVVEVPAGEAREGDTVTEVRTGRVIRSGDDLFEVEWPDGAGTFYRRAEAGHLTITRPSIPLPTEPGAVIRCRVKGLDGIRVAELEAGSDGWIATGIDDMYPDGAVELVEVLYLPSAAAASATGQEAVCACGDPAGSPEHHSSDSDGSHNFSPVPGQEGKA